ncbi:MAG: hypothetical protein AAGA75_05485 [Cyanobacteria bacterium P01_E01_bin.6]
MSMTTKSCCLVMMAIAITACGSLSSFGNADVQRENPSVHESSDSEAANSLLGETDESKPAIAQSTNDTDTNPNESAAIVNAPFPVEVSTFTIDQLFDAGSGGCGMSLWEPETNAWDDGILFFHGLENDDAFMSLNGDLTQLSKTEASGDEFYGQQTSQTFMTDDGAIAVSVNAVIGTPGEIESVSIPNATIIIETQGQTQEISAIGNAGC